MDAERFDGLAKALAHDVSRRHLLAGLLAGVAGLGLSSRGEAQAPPSSAETLSASASGSATMSGLPRTQCAALPRYPDTRSGTFHMSGLTREWCEERDGHFLHSASTCGDASTLCGEFTSAWASSCITCHGVFYESGCVPCLF